MTGGLLFVIHYCDHRVRYREKNNQLQQRLDAALAAIGRRWDIMIKAKGGYDYYSISKGLKTLDPQQHYLTDGKRDIDWFWEMADAIISMNQNISGQLGNIVGANWSVSYLSPSPGIWWPDNYLPTAMFVLTLQPYVLAYPPVAEAGDPLHVVQGTPFVLDGSASWHPIERQGCKIVQYEWDLDGDMLYNELDPQTAPFLVINKYQKGRVKDKSLLAYFEQKGKYKVHLRVTDDQKRTSFDTMLVFIEDRGGHRPLPVIEGNNLQTGTIYGLVGQSVEFRHSTNVQDPDVDPKLSPTDPSNVQERISGYEWDSDGDGQFNDEKTSMITKTFDRDTQGWVGLRVRNPKGEEGVTYRRFQIETNKPPEAKNLRVVSPEPCETRPVECHVDVSDHNWFQSVKMQWLVNGKEQKPQWWYPATGSPISKFQFTPPDNGEYTVTAIAIDRDNPELKSQQEIKIKVADLPPQPKITLVKCEGRTVKMSAEHGDPAGNLDAPFTSSWDFVGERYPGTTVTSQTPDNVFRAECTYTNPGTYTVTITVTDKDTLTGKGTLQVTVK
jgi:hypothetical protein